MANTQTTSKTSQPKADEPRAQNKSGASTMAELMARQAQGVQVLQKGQNVSGTIKKLTPQEILMDIGAKGDALVIEFDKQNLDNLLSLLKVGDRVTASVISPESEEGFPVVSLRRMLDDAIYSRFEKMAATDEPFEIQVTETSRGGYMGESRDGVKGFLPTSQVVGDDNLQGKHIKVKIIEVDRAKKRVIFSQKALSYLSNLDDIKKSFKPGDRVSASVLNVSPYGLFVEVEVADSKVEGHGPERAKRVEGFVHISEIAFERIEDLQSKYKTGEKIEAEVIEIDSSNRRVNLSIKKTLKDTFSEVEANFKAEDKVKAEVTNVATRGITLKIEDGINGFIPSDKIGSGTNYEVGQKVDATVVEFDKKRRVVILSPILKAVPIGYR